MRKYWSTLAERYAKLKLRERMLIAVASIAMLYLVMDTALIAPTKARHRAVVQDTAQKRQQTEALVAQVIAAKRSRGDDPDVANRRRLEELRAQLVALQSEIKDQSARLVPAERMPGVLERLLASNPRLDLVDLKALPRELLDAAGAKPAPRPPEQAVQDKSAKGTQEKSTQDRGAKDKGAQEKSADEASPIIYKYGLEISIRGGYLDLLGYLREIEALPQRLYWQRLDLSVTGYPVAILKLTLYTVSLDSAWMKL